MTPRDPDVGQRREPTPVPDDGFPSVSPGEAWSIGLGILVLVLLATLLAGLMWDRVSPEGAGRAVAALLARR